MVDGDSSESLGGLLQGLGLQAGKRGGRGARLPLLSCLVSVFNLPISIFIFKVSSLLAFSSLTCFRGESYSVQDRTGPDRTGPIRSGPRFTKFSYSVLGPVPVRTGGPNKMGGTVVPLSTA